MRIRHWLIPLLCMALCACNDTGGGLPASSSRAYEVTLVGHGGDSLEQALGQPVEGLPQEEPMFDIVGRKRLDEWSRLARAIVIHQRGTAMSLEQDVWARPQIVVRTDGSDPQRLVRMLNAFEMAQEVRRLRRSHNAKADSLIKRMFGIDMLIPEELGSSMVRKDFIWLSNNTTQGMKNIVVMRGPTGELLARNIKGETDAMHFKLVDERQDRGLWEMEGDAMGGPYVRKRVGQVTVLAFVYAPESKKRNLMRQLEAALYTIKQKQNGK